MARWRNLRRRAAIIQQATGGPPPATTFTETFETGAFDASWSASVISGTGTISVVSTGALTGTYSGKVTKPLNDSTCYRRRTFTATNSVRCGGRYKWLSDSGSSSNNGTGPRIFAGTDRIFDCYRVDSTGQLWLRYQSTGLTGAGALFINTGQTRALNTTTKMEMQCDYAAGANSRIRVWVDDVLRIDQSGLTVFAGGYTAFQIGSEHTVQVVDLLVDDITIDWAPAVPAVVNNVVYSADRKLKLVSDNTIFSARGGNVHTNGFSWSQADFDSMAAQGWNCQRLLVNWKLIEGAGAGVFDTTQIGHVKTSIARAATAGIKTIVCLGITSPVWSDRTNKLPDWSYTSTGPTTPVAPWSGASLFDVYMSHGEAYTRKMIQELGPDDNVIGFDHWNEPDHQPASEVQSGSQRFLGWARGESAGADKLWFVATVPYSSQSSADSFNNWPAITDWTNVVLQVHSYYAPASSTDDGWRTDNGMRDGGNTFWNGSPEATDYLTANKAAMRNHFAPWNATSVARGVPWILGEFGVQFDKATATKRDEWSRDMIEAADLENCAGIFWWIYATNSTSDPWSARPGGTWRPEAARTGTFVA